MVVWKVWKKHLSRSERRWEEVGGMARNGMKIHLATLEMVRAVDVPVLAEPLMMGYMGSSKGLAARAAVMCSILLR